MGNAFEATRSLEFFDGGDVDGVVCELSHCLADVVDLFDKEKSQKLHIFLVLFDPGRAGSNHRNELYANSA